MKTIVYKYILLSLLFGCMGTSLYCVQGNAQESKKLLQAKWAFKRKALIKGMGITLATGAGTIYLRSMYQSKPEFKGFVTGIMAIPLALELAGLLVMTIIPADQYQPIVQSDL